MSQSEHVIELDELLNEIGQFGLFQVRQYGLMILPIVFNALFTLSYVFTAGNLRYRCFIPECEDMETQVYDSAWINESLILPSNNQCLRYKFIWNETALHEKCVMAIDDNNSHILLPCNHFVYQTNENTIVSDFNLTCAENEWKITLVGTVNNIGQFVALPITGYFSDRFGRRLVLLISVAGSALFGLLRSYSTSYQMFLIMEFLDPAIGSTMYTTAFILALELVGPKLRVTGNNIISCAFSFGEALLGLLAMYFNDWRVLLRILYIPGFAALPLLYTTSESVRWLLSKNRKEAALKILTYAANLNGKTVSSNAVENMCIQRNSQSSSEEPTSKSVAQLMREAFASPKLVLRVINCSFCWLTNTMVYYGLSLNSVSLSGNKYFNFILVSLVELPGFFLMQLILDRFGRKRTLFVTLILSGLFCIVSGFVSGTDTPLPKLVLFMLSKLSVTISFGTLYIYTVEIFPTNLRQSLLSMCSMFGRIGSIIAPQTPLLSKIWTPLPMIIFGCLGITSGVAILQFPETLDTDLPSTLDEAMAMESKKVTNKQSDNIQ